MLLGHPKRNGALGTLLGAAGAGPRNPDDAKGCLGIWGCVPVSSWWFQPI